MRPIYIFDLDGTLALIDHRRPILENRDDPQRWRKFYAACDKDLPNRPVIHVMEALLRSGADIMIFSGRSGEVRDKTIAWLAEHTTIVTRLLEGPMLRMRDDGDYTPDDVLKLQWLNRMLHEDRERIVGVFEDRDRMVAMWRSQGLACFQVAPGDF